MKRKEIKKNLEDLKHTRLVTVFALLQGALATIFATSMFTDYVPVQNKLPLAFTLFVGSLTVFVTYTSQVRKLENRVKSLGT